MKTTQFEERTAELPAPASMAVVRRLYPPVTGSRAQMLTGSETEIAARIAEILAEKGLVK